MLYGGEVTTTSTDWASIAFIPRTQSPIKISNVNRFDGELVSTPHYTPHTIHNILYLSAFHVLNGCVAYNVICVCTALMARTNAEVLVGKLVWFWPAIPLYLCGNTDKFERGVPGSVLFGLWSYQSSVAEQAKATASLQSLSCWRSLSKLRFHPRSNAV